jgi:hypothetical protein
MTVAELIAALQEQDPDAAVEVALPSAADAVTGITGVTAMSSAAFTPAGLGQFEVTVYLQGADVISMFDDVDDGEELSRFRVGGFDDEGDGPTEPVKVTCTRCGQPSPWLTYRDDGGADHTTPLSDLMSWAREHQCLRNAGE